MEIVMPKGYLESIKCFIAVVEYKGFANAARHIHMSAPMLTKQIQFLEDSLQKKLFFRTTRQLQLTEAGVTYLEYAKKILADIQAANQAISALEQEPHGHIIIGIPTSLNAKFFAKKLQIFLEQYPKISCTLTTRIDPNHILENQADIVISGTNVINNGLIKEELFSSQAGIYAAPSYLKKYGKPTTVTELLNHNCLINPYVSPNNEWEFTNKKVRVQGNYQSDSGIDIFYAGLHGLGLFYGLGILVADEVAEKKLIEIELDMTLPTKSIFLYYRPGYHGNIINLLAEHLITMTRNCGCK
jgi:DNA-binding transcriptional LysR family regulator